MRKAPAARSAPFHCGGGRRTGRPGDAACTNAGAPGREHFTHIDGSTMTTQLFVYNEALGLLGERRLATSSENREPRRVLDSYWPDVTGYCLGQGLWRFAKRAIQIDNDASLTPQWGFNYCFLIPSDRVRTIVISTSPNLDPPLLQYNEEAGYWYANLTPIYVAMSPTIRPTA
jgi:hypothetical protein